MLLINGKSYLRLELLGRGGSSKVYKVQNNNSKVFAVKKVTFSDMDETIIKGFKGEIDLLQRLNTEDRVVKLYDHEMKPTSVFLVMECGEIDLAHVLNARLGHPLDLSFVRYYATEMLHCLAAVHRHGIVHSDLKPANFLMVKGMLKIIDFGIANVVPEYTVNVHRDTHIGTPNYMAPEALLDANQFDPSAPEGVKCMKVGKPSDVWSCGCIIYQMIYGKPPYASYNGPQRMLAIMNPDVVISYPETGLGGIEVPPNAINLMKGCLQRDPSKRLLVEQVMNSSFLSPRSVEKYFLKELIENAVRYGVDRQTMVEDLEIDFLTDDVWNKMSSKMRI
ncbi:kinase-like protein [Nadsonia fulvescens var. elongata DSM 6958]|uniref:Kinase-like protein n=1 Tax=Nadsonia fulvescens var. elongata DSM 6958 TaxID=857566 RepID=A0A1E3PN36_9ASCO|nr:kinase-like protein [Nadsonia fulvescens var. elongata DSM 6958]